MFKPLTPRTAKRVGISGKPGAGKSSAIFRIAKNPIILDLEDKLPEGRGQLIDLEGRVTYTNVMQKLEALLAGPKPTSDWLAIDSMSALERLATKHCIATDYNNDKVKFSAFQAGPKGELPDYITAFLELLGRLQTKHGLNVLLILHAKPKQANNPTGVDHSKMVIDMKDECATRVLQWVDYLGFVYDEILAEREGQRMKAGEHAVRCISFDNSRPQFDAKSLKPVPSSVPFDMGGRWAETILGKDERNALAA